MGYCGVCKDINKTVTLLQKYVHIWFILLFDYNWNFLFQIIHNTEKLILITMSRFPGEWRCY